LGGEALTPLPVDSPLKVVDPSKEKDPAAPAVAMGCPLSKKATSEPPPPSPEVAASAPSVEDETGKLGFNPDEYLATSS
jgi:hypothetical protein